MGRNSTTGSILRNFNWGIPTTLVVSLCVIAGIIFAQTLHPKFQHFMVKQMKALSTNLLMCHYNSIKGEAIIDDLAPYNIMLCEMLTIYLQSMYHTNCKGD
jgi:hypothetical protein